MIKPGAGAATYCRQKPVARRGVGFTLVEMMVVTIIVGILVATAYANFISAQTKAKTSGVIDNMHTVQIASESYGTDFGGIYIASGTGLGPYMPGGGNSANGAVGIFPTNPLSGAPQEVPFQETITDSATVGSVRNNPPTASPGTVGQTGYAQCDAPACTSYCVTGANDAGLRIGGATFTTVLSNH